MSHKHVLLIMIEPLDTIQKEYKRISYEKRSGHGEIFYEYQHPYKCLDRFISLFFFFRALFFTKSTEVCRKPLLFLLSWSCGFCPWNWPEFLSTCRGFQPGIQCGVVLKVYLHLPHVFEHWTQSSPGSHFLPEDLTNKTYSFIYQHAHTPNVQLQIRDL